MEVTLLTIALIIVSLILYFIIVSVSVIKEKMKRRKDIIRNDTLKLKDELSKNLSQTNEIYDEIKNKRHNYINIIEFEEVKMSTIEYQKKSIASYFKILGKYISNSKKSIHIVERVSGKDILRLLSESPSQENKLKTDFISNKYIEYYNLIEERVQNGIDYKRIFEISINETEIEDEEYLKEDELLRIFGNIINRVTVEHFKDTCNISRDSFYISSSDYFPYSYAIIDNTIILSVYYKKIDQSFFINELYVNRADSVKAQVKKRIKDFKNLLSNSIRIDEIKLENAIESNIETVNYNKKDSEKKLSIIRGDKKKAN